MFDVFVLIDVEKDEWQWVWTTPSNNFADIASAMMTMCPEAKGLQIIPTDDA